MCLNPIHIKHPNREKGDKLEVECGNCLACRHKKVSFLTSCGNYLWNKFGTASFITLTYDNESLIKLNRMVVMPDGEIRPTNRYKDGVELLDRIKKHIIYHKLQSKSLNPNFKYIMATEYGDEGKRCHIHICALGLDHVMLKPILQKKWKFGIVEIESLRSRAGIRYIADYLTKNYFDKELDKKFQELGLEQPKVKHSKDFADEFIKSKIKEIMENKGCYIEKNKKMPIPRYWRDKYNLDKPIISPLIEAQIKMMKQQNWTRKNKRPTAEQIQAYRIKMNELREKQMIEKMRGKGKAGIEERKKDWLYIENTQKTPEIKSLTQQALDRDQDGYPNWVPF